jgi:pimeloyl-ACP methyl ester carboxylesterase
MKPRSVTSAWCAGLLVPLSFLVTGGGCAAADEKSAELPRKVFFGAEIRTPTAVEREKPNLKDRNGVIVERVFPASSAAEADIRVGDFLTSIQGDSIGEPAQLIAAVAARRAGDALAIALVRDREEKTAKVVLKPRALEVSDAYRVIYGAVLSRGNRLRTIATRPKDERKHPALFLIQGLGSSSIETIPGAPGGYSRIIDDFSRRGFVTVRVDKPGQGDSEGGPTPDIDFETELDGYRQTLKALRSFHFVDSENVIIFGHSMGGVMGPLLGAEMPLKGIAVYGTVAKTWHEYTRENVRRQHSLGGSSFAEIDRAIRKDEEIDHYLSQGLSPTEIAAAHPELKGRLDDWYVDGKYLAGTHYAYFRQLAATNLADAWEKFGGHTLAVWGKSDFVSGEEDHALIARIINRAHPGRGEFLAIDGIDHGFNRSPSQEESFKNFRKPDREFNPVFLDSLRDWATKVCGDS